MSKRLPGIKDRSITFPIIPRRISRPPLPCPELTHCVALLNYSTTAAKFQSWQVLALSGRPLNSSRLPNYSVRRSSKRCSARQACPMTVRTRLPKPGRARAVQIDLNPIRIGLRYPVEVGLVGDSAKSLAALIPLLKRKDDRGFLSEAQEGMRKWNALMVERATRKDRPMKPQVVAHELGRRL